MSDSTLEMLWSHIRESVVDQVDATIEELRRSMEYEIKARIDREIENVRKNLLKAEFERGFHSGVSKMSKAFKAREKERDAVSG